jgi:hypothetical protein
MSRCLLQSQLLIIGRGILGRRVAVIAGDRAWSGKAILTWRTVSVAWKEHFHLESGLLQETFQGTEFCFSHRTYFPFHKVATTQISKTTRRLSTLKVYSNGSLFVKGKFVSIPQFILAERQHSHQQEKRDIVFSAASAFAQSEIHCGSLMETYKMYLDHGSQYHSNADSD